MSDAVPLLDLSAQNGPLRSELLAAMEGVMDSQRFIQGPEVQALEREIVAALSLGHALGVSSGTDALLLAMMEAGIGHGDEVITTPFSFFATAGCVARLGATPVFVDIDPATFNLDPRHIESAITARTRAIMPVHLFGQPADMDPILEVANRHSLLVIEDAAQALGATYRDRPVGTLGDHGCFSFFPSKNMGCFGDGGLLTTSEAARHERARILRTHGANPKYFHEVVGGNFRLDALQAAVLRVKLPHLQAWTDGRRRNAADYDAWFAAEGLPEDLLQTPRRMHPGHVYNQYVIRTSRRDGLREALQKAQVGCEIYYPRPLHLQQCFAELGGKEGQHPQAEYAAREVLALPIYAELGESARQRVVQVVVDFLRS